MHITDTSKEPMQAGKFQPEWESLKQYECPEWFRDAKFGLWAHWGPQCQPENGDWYARHMYFEGHKDYEFHVAKYGHPSQFGFKDVMNEWKAENWKPEEIVALYKRVGAQYFFAMANHHDNLDLYDSTHHAWNSTKVGPMRDIIGEWAKAARAHNLPLGVSVHAAHVWTWMEGAQGADKHGPLAGVPYDGKLTKADGKGLWWEGFDPQELYAQNHERSEGSENPDAHHRQWEWGNGASVPDAAFCENIYNRTIDLINKYQPDLLYFDDTVLPLHPISDAGLKIAAHYYNDSMKRHGGNVEAVLFGKILDEEQREMMVWDIERGQSDRIEPLPWQACTCIGGWHYDRKVFENHAYKSAQTVIQTLADVVSKNGNLLLSVPVRGDGTLDSDEIAVLEGIAAWMQINRECIFGTRPWTKFGEGPASENANPLQGQGFNEGTSYTAQDIRFTTKGDTLYAILMDWPGEEITIKSLASGAAQVADVGLLGSDAKLDWSQSADGLKVELPVSPGAFGGALKIRGVVSS